MSQKGEYDDKLRPTTFFQEQEKLTFQCVTYDFSVPKDELIHKWAIFGKKNNSLKMAASLVTLLAKWLLHAVCFIRNSNKKQNC